MATGAKDIRPNDRGILRPAGPRRRAARRACELRLALDRQAEAAVPANAEEHVSGRFASSSGTATGRSAACAGWTRYRADRAEPLAGFDRLFCRWGMDRPGDASG